MLREGYGPLIDALAQDIDIQTSSVVEKIEYSPDTHCEVFVKGADESIPGAAYVKGEPTVTCPLLHSNRALPQF